MKILVTAFVFLLAACSNRPSADSLEAVNRDVSAGRNLLKQVERYNDSLSLALSLFDRRIEEILLLSKDVENPGACALKANRYFESAFEELSLNDANRLLITARMGKDEMELRIRQNELYIINELVFQNSGSDPRLFSVPEKMPE